MPSPGYELVKEHEEKEFFLPHHNPYIVTSTGTPFTYRPVNPDAIHIEDIAHALSHICRFNGHTNLFYSVAQHCLFIESLTVGTVGDRLSSLLHDAGEAYMCDIPAPLKPLLGPKYAELYAEVQGAINDKFGVTSLPGSLRSLDKAACAYEAKAFFGFTDNELEQYGYDVNDWIRCDRTPTQFASDCGDEEPGMVAAKFLKKFEELMDALGRSH